MKRRLPCLSLCLLLSGLAAIASAAEPLKSYNAAELQLALRKLANTGTALYVGAHPDDENTAALSWLESGRLVRAAYLSLTRGDGGQNIIGSEKGPLLGVVRTQELLAARRVDDAEQFFTRAVDYGYSKSAEEAHRIWEKESVLADVVWTIRTFRPDVIITRFPSDGGGGHGQHTSSAILAREAFRAAADPKRFPEQLTSVTPWQARRIVWNAWAPLLEQRKVDLSTLVHADLGAFNPLLGRSYAEIAGISRSMHRSQGDGTPQRRGSLLNYFEHWDGVPASNDLFEGVDLTWSRIPNSAPTGKLLAQAASDFDSAEPSAIVPQLLAARREMDRLGNDPLVQYKKRETEEAIRAAAGLWFDAVTPAWHTTPGSSVPVKVSIVNRSPLPLRLIEVRAPHATPVTNRELPENTMVQADLSVNVPADAATTGPHFLRGGVSERFLYPAGDQRPEGDPAVPVTFVFAAGDQRLEYTIPAMYKWTDRIMGDQYRPFEIVPPVSLRFSETVLLFPTPSPTTVKVTVHAESDGVSGLLRLQLPAGWKSKPESEPVRLEKRDDVRVVSFLVTPTSETSAGTAAAEFLIGDKRYRHDLTTIDYPHIPAQTIIAPAEMRLVREEIRTTGETVGYIVGPGDEVPDALRQMGFRLTLLQDEEIASGDLSRYDTIVAGVRSYNVRDALKKYHPRLMEYVEKGGRYVVQYQTPDETLAKEIGPYPIQISRDRVSDETAPVTILRGDHPLVTSPNRITPRDFEGWVQERGLTFARTFDPRYETVLASHDPGENDLPGGMLFARHGKGIYIYTGYAWFRQLPAGVPGAYRIFANIVSGGRP